MASETREVISNNLSSEIPKKTILEKFANIVLYLGAICCFLCILAGLYLYSKEDADGWFLVILWLIIWWIIWWLCRGIYKIIILWVNNNKRNLELSKEEDRMNSLVDESTGRTALSLDLIPNEMLESYTSIKRSWFRLFENTSLSSVRTQYIHTINTDHRGRQEDTNDCLFIEHQFPQKDLYLDVYVQVKPDSRDNIWTNILYFLFGPGIIAWVLFDDDLEAFTFLAEIVSSYGINVIVFFIFLFFFSGYISYLIKTSLGNRNAVRLESHEFEKWFDVNSNDPIIARQICDPTFIADLDSWLTKNNLKKYSEIYFDFRLNRLIYKFDFMLVDKTSELSEEYVKNCIALTTQMIEKISILRNMAVVYASGIALKNIKT